MTIIITMIDKVLLDKIKSGARVRVWESIKDGDKSRLSSFEGIVLSRKHGNEPGATFTVRATIAGVGVEKIYPINSPSIDKAEILSSPKKVKKSKLYYLRELPPKKIRQKLQKLNLSI